MVLAHPPVNVIAKDESSSYRIQDSVFFIVNSGEIDSHTDRVNFKMILSVIGHPTFTAYIFIYFLIIHYRRSIVRLMILLRSPLPTAPRKAITLLHLNFLSIPLCHIHIFTLFNILKPNILSFQTILPVSIKGTIP